MRDWARRCEDADTAAQRKGPGDCVSALHIASKMAWYGTEMSQSDSSGDWTNAIPEGMEGRRAVPDPHVVLSCAAELSERIVGACEMALSTLKSSDCGRHGSFIHLGVCSCYGRSCARAEEVLYNMARSPQAREFTYHPNILSSNTTIYQHNKSKTFSRHPSKCLQYRHRSPSYRTSTLKNSDSTTCRH